MPKNSKPATVSVLNGVCWVLADQPKGLPWSALVAKREAPPTDVAAELNAALDTGEVYFSLTDEGWRFTAASHVTLPDVPEKAVDGTLTFIDYHDASGLADITISAHSLLEGLAPTYPAKQVLAALEQLRKESLIWFQVYATGALTVTLARYHSFTVLAYDGDAHQALCFHVRAHDAQSACNKVATSSYGTEDLNIFGASSGWLTFSGAPNPSSLMMERV